MITATIQNIYKLNEVQLSVVVSFSDDTRKEFELGIDTDKQAIKQVVKEELARLNAIEAKIERLKDLIGTTI